MDSKRYLSLVFLAIASLAFCSFQDIEGELENIPRDSLVVLSIDALICPEDLVLRECWAPFRLDWFQTHFGLSSAEIDWLMRFAWERTRFDHCDRSVLKWIRKCSKRGIRIIGFSECGVERLVLERLRYLEFDFGRPLGSVFPRWGWFSNGILFCGHHVNPLYISPYTARQKAELLGLFLDQWKYRHVVCFFSCRETLHEVKRVLSWRGMGFAGYLIQPCCGDLNERIASFQLETLCKHQRWLSDHEAAEY